MIHTIPNYITAARFGLTVALYIILGLITTDPEMSLPAIQSLGRVAFILFVIASASDFLDGYVARLMNQESALGRMLDPFVDKLLVVGSMVFLCAMDQTQRFLPAWVVVVIVVREFFVTGIRSVIEFQGGSFSADIFGKIKMGLQCFAVANILLLLGWGEVNSKGELGAGFWETSAHILVWATLISTIVSGVIYSFKIRGKLLLEEVPK